MARAPAGWGSRGHRGGPRSRYPCGRSLDCWRARVLALARRDRRGDSSPSGRALHAFDPWRLAPGGQVLDRAWLPVRGRTRTRRWRGRRRAARGVRSAAGPRRPARRSDRRSPPAPAGNPRHAAGPRPSTRENPAGLTARELDVLALLAEGLRNAQIAERLVVSEKTVDHHVSAILRKLDVRTRGEASAQAARLRLTGST
ncbi:MAG: response regulator transcription factor [Solirubrobacterales bacterium]|nr:response regulator transcription factor [Solirubrobacterales bacterium]